MERSLVNQAVLEAWKNVDPNGWHKLVGEIIEVFLNISWKQYDLLKEAWKQRDFEKMRQIAHSLKSTCGNVGAEIAYDLLNTLENDLQKNEAEIEEMIGTLDRVFALTVAELTKHWQNQAA